MEKRVTLTAASKGSSSLDTPIVSSLAGEWLQWYHSPLLATLEDGTPGTSTTSLGWPG